jgi:hypothetical protein
MKHRQVLMFWVQGWVGVDLVGFFGNGENPVSL